MIFQRAYMLPLLLSPLGLLIPLAPRSGPLWVLLLGIVGIVHYVRRRPSLDWLRSPPVYFLGVFLAYLFLSTLWSATPERSFEQAFRLSALAFFGLAAFSLVRSLTATQRDNVVKCLADFVGFEPAFSHYHSQRLNIAKTMLVTNLAFFSLLPWLWPRQKALAVSAYFIFLAVCFYSDSQSSLVACMAGGAVFALGQISVKWTPKLIAVALILGLLLVLPLTQSPTLSAPLTKNLPTVLKQGASVKIRLKVYKFFGDQILTRPILGHGLEAGVKYTAPNIDYQGVAQAIRTPHSILLQALFDLGYLGSALMLLVLLWPIKQIYVMRGPHMATALLLPLCVMIAATLFNFVIWRTWIPGATILAALFMIIHAHRPPEKT
jgi:O-antigen ligase